MEELIVTKAGGEQVVFSVEKLRQSLRNAGASEEVIDSVIDEVLPKLHSGISTRKIYRMAFTKLKNRSKHLASRYKLKRAIMELGPDGFVFEHFVSALLTRKGYETKVGIVLQGKCISHEIDVIAKSAKETILVECKYHSQPGKISDVKIPLYIRSRFEDVSSNKIQYPELQETLLSCLIVTNTRFSPDAMTYARCIGLDLLGWDYPHGNGIKDWIDELHMYPITCLSTLTNREKESLLKQNVLFCEDLIEQAHHLEIGNYSNSRIKNILDEAQKLTFG